MMGNSMGQYHREMGQVSVPSVHGPRMLRLGVDIVGLGKGDSQGGVAIDLPRFDLLHDASYHPIATFENVMFPLLNV